MILTYQNHHKIAEFEFEQSGGEGYYAEIRRIQKPIKFSDLPSSNILGFMQIEGRNEKNRIEPCIVLHYMHQLKFLYAKSGKVKISIDRMLKRRNIIYFNNRLFFWEDRGRVIERLESPIAKDESNFFHTVYEAKNTIKLCKKVEYIKDKQCILICDEEKYLKIMTYDEINKKFKIEREFFVGNNFAVNEDFNHLHTFSFSNNMLYSNSETYLLQDRKSENKLDEEIRITEPKSFVLKTPAFPLVSDKFILKLVDTRGENIGSGRMRGTELYLSPPADSQKSLNNASFSAVDIEFFLHSDPTKIVRIKRLYFELEAMGQKFRQNLQVEIEFSLINGLRVGKTKRLPPTASEEIQEVLVSQSGEFLCIVTLKDDNTAGVYKYIIAPSDGEDFYQEHAVDEDGNLVVQEDADGRIRTDAHLQPFATDSKLVFEVSPGQEYTIAGVSKAVIQLGRWKVTDYGTVVFLNLKEGLFFVDLENKLSQNSMNNL